MTTVSTTTIASSSNTSSVVDKEQMPPTEIPGPIKELILNHLVNQSKAAVVMGFVDANGTRVFSFGNLSKEHNIPVNESTLFHIGSITKTFTTLLLADMVKQGIINLEDPIAKYLPAGVKVPEYKGHKITIEELASHTSGLPEFPSNYGGFLPKPRLLDPNFNANSYTANKLYQGLSNTTLTREPGSKFAYSNFGMGLLGHIHIQNQTSWMMDRNLMVSLIANSVDGDAIHRTMQELQKVCMEQIYLVR